MSAGRSNALSETEIIAQANRDLDAEASTLLEALEAFYGNGFADQLTGDVEYLDGHVFRVHRWLVWTDNYGFKSVSEYDSEAEATAEVDRYDAEIAASEEEAE